MTLSQQIEQKKLSVQNNPKFYIFEASYVLREMKMKSDFILKISKKKDQPEKEKKEEISLKNKSINQNDFSKSLKLKNLFYVYFLNIFLAFISSLFFFSFTEKLLEYSFNFLSTFNNKIIKENILWISGKKKIFNFIFLFIFILFFYFLFLIYNIFI